MSAFHKVVTIQPQAKGLTSTKSGAFGLRNSYAGSEANGEYSI